VVVVVEVFIPPIRFFPTVLDLVEEVSRPDVFRNLKNGVVVESMRVRYLKDRDHIDSCSKPSEPFTEHLSVQEIEEMSEIL